MESVPSLAQHFLSNEGTPFEIVVKRERERAPSIPAGRAAEEKIQTTSLSMFCCCCCCCCCLMLLFVVVVVLFCVICLCSMWLC